MNENTDRGVNKSVINWYPGHMAKTKRLISEKLNLIDMVYEVIDARIPYASKIVDINQYIKDKPRLLIMTKVDLCDKKETNQWKEYYEKMGYTVIGVNLMNSLSIQPIIQKTLEYRNQICQSLEKKGLQRQKVRVLVVGIPNVGKSTLINRLVGKKATNVGNKPGVTKSLNWIRVQDDIELLDTPGILWPKLEEGSVALHLACFTAIKEEVLPLDEVAIYLLKALEKYYPRLLQERFGISNLDEDIITNIEEIGKRRGCFIRGGEIDYDKVYHLILNDVKEGRISGITLDRVKDYGN